jgi:large subunit ribosomal protein L6
MSRKGKQPITLPKGVEVKTASGQIQVKGPKGQLARELPEYVHIKTENDKLIVDVQEDVEEQSATHGLWRAIVNNLVLGVSQGFEKRLEMIGVGYRAAVKGNQVDIQVGYSHPTTLPIPEGINVAVEKNTMIVITGMDKQKVGQFAADIRSKKPPEPYQGKGIRYQGEYVRKKAGKAAGK